MASAPTVFDARTSYSVGEVRDQGDCNTCVSFAVLGALQAAVSAALGRRLGANSSLSVQKLYFCNERTLRGCDVGMSLQGALEEATALHEKDELVVDACLPYTPQQSSPQCTPTCTQSFPELGLGTLRTVQLSSIANMQQHIREHGSIICAMELYTTTSGEQELKKFYAGGVYNRTGGRAAGPGEAMVLDMCWNQLPCCQG
jgi:C1A family cysteine protease